MDILESTSRLVACYRHDGFVAHVVFLSIAYVFLDFFFGVWVTMKALCAAASVVIIAELASMQERRWRYKFTLHFRQVACSGASLV